MYTGDNKYGADVIFSDTLLYAGKTVTVTPIVWSTYIDYNTPGMEVEPAYSHCATCTWNDSLKKADVALHRRSDVPMRVYIFNGDKTHSYNSMFYIFISLEFDEGVYFIKNKKIDKYMQIDDNTAPNYNKDNAKMEIWDFDGGNHQKWKFEHVGDGYYKIISVKSGKALSVMTDCENKDKEALVQQDYTGSARQKWKLSKSAGGAYIIRPQSGEDYGTDWCMSAGVQFLGVTDGLNVEQRPYTVGSDLKDEWVLTKIQYSATVYNYYDAGYYIRYGESETTSVNKINSYMDEVYKQYLKLLGLEITAPTTTYYASAIDICKGNVNSSNVDILCSHTNPHTVLFSSTNSVYNHFNNNTSPSGSNIITNVYWSGHRIKTYPNVEEYNRCYSSNTSIFMLELSSSSDRDQDSKGILMHELNHQYGAPDHYHEILDKGTPDERCRGGDICSVCGDNRRPRSCVMNESRIDITAETVICSGCKADIYAHLEEHHRP